MSEKSAADSREGRIDAVIADYLDAVRSGKNPDPDEWLSRHPELAPELASFFAGKAELARLAPAAVEAPTVGAAAQPADGSLGLVRYFGDYELLEEVARGGMGVVYKARQVSLNRVVALKMILAGELASADDVRRFRTEAEAAANLDHPNIVPIYEVGEHEGRQYFSMKFVEGGSLAGDIERLTKKPKEAAGLLAKAARAVHFAHQHGVLHRDLKPANILLGEDKEPYIADFGLARRIDADVGQTRSGAIVGTPSYMAPEQARGVRLPTTAADVYALGAILYECLTGRPPFRADTPLDTVLQVMDVEPTLPTAVNPKADPDLAAVALRCLEKEPARRYPSAEALADDLERWQNGEPITVRRAGFWQRQLRWLTRHPAAFLVTVAPYWAVMIFVSLYFTIFALSEPSLRLPLSATIGLVVLIFFVPPLVLFFLLLPVQMRMRLLLERRRVSPWAPPFPAAPAAPAEGPPAPPASAQAPTVSPQGPPAEGESSAAKGDVPAPAVQHAMPWVLVRGVGNGAALAAFMYWLISSALAGSPGGFGLGWGEATHFIAEGALAFGLASSFVWLRIGAPERNRRGLWRVLDPLVGPPVLGAAMTALIVGAWRNGDSSVSAALVACLGLVALAFIGRPGRRRQTARGVLGLVAINGCPVVGYFVGFGAAHLAGEGTLAAAPLYGMMLGAVLATLLLGVPYAAPARDATQTPLYSHPYPLYNFRALLSSCTVRQALGVTDEQLKRATDLARPIADRHYLMVEAAQKVGPHGILEKMPELLDLQEKDREEINTAVEAVLTPEQVKRYRQIRLQSKGVRALSAPEVEKALRLTDDQKNRINAIDRRLHQDVADMPGIRSWNVQAQIKVRTNRSRAAMEEIVAVLNDEQKKAWKELAGEPVEFRYRSPVTETASGIWRRITAVWRKFPSSGGR